MKESKLSMMRDHGGEDAGVGIQESGQDMRIDRLRFSFASLTATPTMLTSRDPLPNRANPVQ